MKKTIPVTGSAGDFMSRDDASLIAFIANLRLAVKAKVTEEQKRGLQLSEIVEQVREMVRVAEEDPKRVKNIRSSSFPAISRQAIGWCFEAFRPGPAT